jgi:hypothetical protein
MACLLLGPGAAPDDVYHFNLREFTIPIDIQQDKQAQVREVVLYASTDMGRSWEVIGRASGEKFSRSAPDRKTGFNYQAKSDGMHWFSIAIVYKNGTQEPADVSKAPPGQKILIDTVKPQARITSAQREGSDVVVTWEVQEDRPDWATFRLEYKSAESPATWSPLPVTPGVRGTQKFKPAQAGAVTVRLSMKDLAGNEGADEKAVPSGASAPENTLTRVTPPDPLPGGGGSVIPPPPPYLGSGAPLTGSPGPEGSKGSDSGSVISSGASPIAGTSLPSEGAPQKRPELKITNKPDVKIAFDVDKVGPSGLGSVDVYMTTDEGASWEKVKDPVGVQLPPSIPAPGAPVSGRVTVRLAREGVVYGFAVVVRSKLGLGAPEPKPGDAPQVRVELDTLAPAVDLFRPEPDPSRPDHMVLSWKCTDRNLAASPITIEWAEHATGPWQLIGGPELPNRLQGGPHRQDATGSHVWHITGQIPPQVYLRLTARDRAGNASKAESRQPVPVDTSRPIPKDVRIED